MENLSVTFCLVIGVLFGSVSLGLATGQIPTCEGSPLSKEKYIPWEWHNCFGSFNNNGTVYVGEFQNREYHGFGTIYYGIGDQYAGNFCSGFPCGKGVFTYKNGISKKTCGGGIQLKQSNQCNGNKEIQPSLLRTTFKKLSQSQRKLIQSNLKDLGLYKSSIDGLYGKGTAGALTAYNKQYLGGADLKKSANVKKLIDTVLALKTASKPKATASPAQPKDTYKVASGTGFYVSDQGHIITNHHVIDGCKNMKVHSNGKVLETLKIAYDELNDLALLKISGEPSHVFALSSESAFPLQDIVVAGFPFGDEISSSLKFTRGIVSSLTGIGNNYSEIQIDAALQPGNSGGPIMDEFGNIVGVAVAKLDIKAIIEDYGVIPENTNFGVKSSAVRNIMEGNSIPFKSPNTEVISKRELSQIATDGTVFLTCWMTMAQIERMRSKKVLFKDLD